MFKLFECCMPKRQPQTEHVPAELEIIRNKIIFAFDIQSKRIVNISESRGEDNKLSILLDNLILAQQLRDTLHAAQALESDSGTAEEIEAHALQDSSEGAVKGNAKLVIIGNAVAWFERYVATKAEEKCCVLTCTVM